MVIKLRKWYYSNNFNWNCAPDFGFAIKIKKHDLFCFSFQGLKRQKYVHPFADKINISFSSFRKELSFRIGIQNKTWFWIRCCEFHNLMIRLKNLKSPFPF